MPCFRLSVVGCAVGPGGRARGADRVGRRALGTAIRRDVCATHRDVRTLCARRAHAGVRADRFSTRRTTKDDFEYWDLNGNGDLTCTEALGRDEGLRLPAYLDNRDGTGIIYQWLERSRSSDSDNDGVACESGNNPNGYVPKAMPPVEPEGCPADAEVWRGLQVCEEQPRVGYDRDAFGSGYRSLEDDIIRALPPTMRSSGQVYTPYSCIAFDIEADGTDIEHIVALA